MRSGGEWYKGFNQGIVPIALSQYYLKNIPVEETIKNHNNIYDFCKTYNVSGLFTAETYKLDEDFNEFDHKKEQKTNRYYVSTDGIKFRKRGEPLKPKYDKRRNLHDFPETLLKIKEIVNSKINDAIEEGLINESIQAKIKLYVEKDIYSLIWNSTSEYYKYLNYFFNVSRVEVLRANDTKFEISIEKDWRLIDIEAGEYLVTLFNTYEEKSFEEYNINYDYYIEEALKIIETIDHTREKREREERERKEKERLDKIEEKERKERERKERREIEKRRREEDNYLKFCVYKKPTRKQFETYKRDWLIEKYGEITEFKESNKKTLADENSAE